MGSDATASSQRREGDDKTSAFVAIANAAWRVVVIAASILIAVPFAVTAMIVFDAWRSDGSMTCPQNAR